MEIIVRKAAHGVILAPKITSGFLLAQWSSLVCCGLIIAIV